MRKRFFTVCIAILIVLVCVLAAGCTSRASYDIKETSLREGGKGTAVLVKEICENYPDRTMGTGADYAFIRYLAAEMQSYGYPAATFEDEGGTGGSGTGGGQTELSDTNVSESGTGATVSVNEFEFSNYYTQEKEKGYNLVYDIPAATDTKDTVLLLASYDNCAGLVISSVDYTTGQTTKDKIGGEGAYSNATGVAVLLRIAYELADKQLPYNLSIAFVDCGENSWDGAAEVAKKYENSEGNFICLNFNRLGAGDYTYIYSDESSQAYNDYFYSAVKKTDSNGVFAEIPMNKQVADIKFIDAQKTDCSHFAMYGDNLVFNIRGLAVASYVSFNWSAFEHPFYTETAGYENVMGTSADTYKVLTERLGGGEEGEKVLAQRLDAVVLNAVTAISADNASTLFGAVESSDPAKSGNYADAASVASLIVKIAIIAACVIAAIVLTFKVKDNLVKKQKEKFERMQREANVTRTAQPSAEDIFSLGGENKGDKEEENDKSGNKGNGGSDGSDDIFEGF